MKESKTIIRSSHFVPETPFVGAADKRKAAYEEKEKAHKEAREKWHIENPSEKIKAEEEAYWIKWEQDEIDAYQKSLQPIKHILLAPDEVNVYVIEKPDPMTNWDLFKDGKAKLVVTLHGEEAKEATAPFCTEKTIGDRKMCMFDPGIGLTIKKGCEKADILICLHCREISINGDVHGSDDIDATLELLIRKWVKNDELVDKLRD